MSGCKPILGKLFGQLSHPKTIEDWDQALSEIFTFAYFESLGILHSIGWPSDFPGDPPFDFSLSVPGGILTGDVKPANGSGYRLLEANLRKCVAEQATRSGIEDPGVTIRYRGPLTQEVVGPSLPSVTSEFAKMISPKRLSEPETFFLTIGSTRVTVMVGNTKDHGGGITGSSTLSDKLAPTLERHLKSKGKSASKYNVPFLMAYVRLPGRGAADLKTHQSFGDTLSKACALLKTPIPNWLGTVFLSFGTPKTEPRFYEGSTAAWPPHLSALSLSQNLGAVLTQLPSFLEDVYESKQNFSIPDPVRRDGAD